jgi:hypothetical protein
MKVRQKRRLAGPTTGCCPNQDTCIEEKQRYRQPTVRYNEQNKRGEKNIHKHRHTSIRVGMYDCMRSERESDSELGNELSGILRRRKMHTCVSVYVYVVYEERERISVTLVTTAAQGVCEWSAAGAHRDTKTISHTHATLKTQANTCQVMIENQHFHSSTVRSTQPRKTRTLT